MNQQDALGRTALGEAAASGRKDAVRLLLDRGAAIDGRDSRGRTPLMHAAKHGHTDVAALLLGRGAALLMDDNSWGPLHHAAASGCKDMVELLLEKGADVHASTTPPSYFKPLDLALHEGHVTVAQVLRQVNCFGNAVEIPTHGCGCDWLASAYQVLSCTASC